MNKVISGILSRFKENKNERLKTWVYKTMEKYDLSLSDIKTMLNHDHTRGDKKDKRINDAYRSIFLSHWISIKAFLLFLFFSYIGYGTFGDAGIVVGLVVCFYFLYADIRIKKNAFREHILDITKFGDMSSTSKAKTDHIALDESHKAYEAIEIAKLPQIPFYGYEHGMSYGISQFLNKHKGKSVLLLSYNRAMGDEVAASIVNTNVHFHTLFSLAKEYGFDSRDHSLNLSYFFKIKALLDYDIILLNNVVEHGDSAFIHFIHSQKAQVFTIENGQEQGK